MIYKHKIQTMIGGKKILISLLFFTIVFFACDRDNAIDANVDCELIKVAYQNNSSDISIIEVKPILDTSCAPSSSGNNCHYGNTDYTNYESYDNMKPTLNHIFDREVLESFDMPKPNTLGITLSELDRAYLRCWSEADFPEIEE